MCFAFVRLCRVHKILNCRAVQIFSEIVAPHSGPLASELFGDKPWCHLTDFELSRHVRLLTNEMSEFVFSAKLPVLVFTSAVDKMAEECPCKADINAIFKRLRSIPANRVGTCLTLYHML